MVSPYVLLKTALFSLLGPGTIAGVIPRMLTWLDGRSRPVDSRVTRLAAGVSVVSGILLYLHTAWRFASEGTGTPSPYDEPEELVTGGVYAHVRNPMYLGLFLCIGGQALLYRSVLVLWYGIVLWLGAHVRVIGYEEPHLSEKHGEAYERYCERVPRWLPRLRRASGV